VTGKLTSLHIALKSTMMSIYLLYTQKILVVFRQL
jgi:hypothetical protein